jgi:predicted Zn-dependent protease
MSLLKKLIICFAVLAAMGITQARAADDMNILRDEETEQDLKTMITPIFKQAGLSPDTVKFIIVESNELNAFVAGGQNIFLYTELVLKTDNPEELFGVIAHETGHIADGHLFRGAQDMQHLSMEAILGQLMGVAVGIAGHSSDGAIAISSASNSLLTRTLLRHTRTQEGSADRAGVRFLQGAGLPVTGFLSFMKKLESQELVPETEQSEYVQTHPLTQDRIDSLQHAVDDGPPGHTPPEWYEMHRRIKAKLLGYLFPDRSLADHDNSRATEYGHAIAWFRKNEPDKAIATVDPLIAAEPQNPYFYELKGQILFANGRVEESVPVYARAAQYAPFSGLIRTAYAQSLLESKQDQSAHLTEAVKQLNLAIDVEKQDSEPHHLLAIAYGKQGQEGLSRLQLAEEALLEGNASFAKREAGLARTKLQRGTPAWQRASDILDLVSQNEKGGDRGKKG